MIRNLPTPVLLVLLGLLFLSGCGEEGTSPATATVTGNVVDPSGNAIVQVRVGILYFPAFPSSSPVSGASPQPTQEPVRLGGPYPNPTRTPAGEELTIRLNASADTTARIEIWTTFGGVPGSVRRLFSGAVSRDTTLTWDGRDDFDLLVPNGLYQVRLTVPANPPQGTDPWIEEVPVLLNRSPLEMESLDPFVEGQGFNSLTDAEGRFTITDLAVGEGFPAAAVNGASLGQASVRSVVDVVFRDPDHAARDVETVVGPGDVVELNNVLLTRLAALIASRE